MTAQGRLIAAGWLAVLWCGLTGAAEPRGQAPVEAATRNREALRGDAALHDVWFVTPDCGWAVGDHGAIWHTTNGGRAWQLQESGVTCPLESVCFLDAERGWAAGGWTHPYTHITTGVLVGTEDGGAHWTANARLVLPALKRVRFVDAKHGWALGSPSAMFPSGVLMTDNGGRSWEPVPGAAAPAWQGGDLLGPECGAIVGPRGSLACLHGSGLVAAQTPPLGLRSATQVRLVPPSYGLLVGEGGLVLLTPDAGSTWQPTPSPLPEGLAGRIDFRALEIRGARCWMAGSPGSRILTTADAGRSWSVAATPQTLPLESLYFVDEQHGWAVGQLGTILASDDGGQNWKRQRAGGARLALLGLVADAQDVPLELLAELSGDEGYRSYVEVLGRRDLETSASAERELSDRLHEAVLGVGGCGASVAWQFPLRPAGLQLSAEQILAGWDQLHGGRGLQELEAHLIRQIRMWRPEVLLTNDQDPQAPAGEQIGQMVLRAAELAAQPNVNPEETALLGLGPWTVKRVYTAMKGDGHGAVELSGSLLAPRLGRTLIDLAACPRGLLERRCSDVPESFGFQVIGDSIAPSTPSNDFFRGITLEPGGEARRRLLESLADPAASAARLTQKQRNLRAVLERTQDPQLAQSLLAQVSKLLDEVDADSGALLLFRLGHRYEAAGLWPLAAEVYPLLADRYPQHPLTRPAMLWLLHYYSSGEVAARVGGPKHGAAAGGRLEQAQIVAQQIQRTCPQLSTMPEIGFALAAAQRQGGAARQAERFYQTQARSTGGGLWHDCARGEQWLADPRGPCVRPVLRCQTASAKPHLDGRLDDDLWKQAERAELHGTRPEENWPTTVQIAYDDQFLYLGVDCQHAAGVRYDMAQGTRPRDADLSAEDRLELLVDVDRDYATFLRLTVDSRGWTSEACWGDASWNPTWFVAAATDNGHWTIEAALPLEQLSAEPIHAQSAWALGLQRIIPGVGLQSWNTPASLEGLPEGFGYLVFQ